MTPSVANCKVLFERQFGFGCPGAEMDGEPPGRIRRIADFCLGASSGLAALALTWMGSHPAESVEFAKFCLGASSGLAALALTWMGSHPAESVELQSFV